METRWIVQPTLEAAAAYVEAVQQQARHDRTAITIDRVIAVLGTYIIRIDYHDRPYRHFERAVVTFRADDAAQAARVPEDLRDDVGDFRAFLYAVATGTTAGRDALVADVEIGYGCNVAVMALDIDKLVAALPTLDHAYRLPTASDDDSLPVPAQSLPRKRNEAPVPVIDDEEGPDGDDAEHFPVPPAPKSGTKQWPRKVVPARAVDDDDDDDEWATKAADEEARRPPPTPPAVSKTTRTPLDAFRAMLDEIANRDQFKVAETPPGLEVSSFCYDVSSAILSIVNNACRVAGVEIENRASEVRSARINDLVNALVDKPVGDRIEEYAETSAEIVRLERELDALRARIASSGR